MITATAAITTAIDIPPDVIAVMIFGAVIVAFVCGIVAAFVFAARGLFREVETLIAAQKIRRRRRE